jgi:5,6-dimethylbenzimidazole synthase
MDLFTAIMERRSCRNYLPDPVDEATLEKILEAATWAPSPLNAQPWEFVVVTSQAMKEKIFAEADYRRKWIFEKSGWKWMDRYQVDFLKTAPALIAVTGDPTKTGADSFMEGGEVAYQLACAAAIQNMMLAAQDQGLGSLWYTLFDRKAMGEILGTDPGKPPLSIVCLGKAAGSPSVMARKDVKEKIRYIR